ncbi:hypothetical protein LTR28_001101, partial [Elasticomyces elasticus]
GKRIFIKDIIHYLVPPDGKPASIAPSLQTKKRGVGTEAQSQRETNGEVNGEANGVANGNHSIHLTNGAANGHLTNGAANGHLTNGAVKDTPSFPYATAPEPGNPTVIPSEILKQFHFAFLIRHPKSSIPSYYRCTVPPLDKLTGFYNFNPSEAGYDEVRRVFDYLRSTGQIGPAIAGQEHASNGTNGASKEKQGGVQICVVDADDLLDNPEGILEKFCASVGLDYTPDMLNWDNEEDHRVAKEAFEKWPGFHEDAINSVDLKPRLH